MEEYISKYITGELQREEWEELRSWLNQNEENKKLFTQLVSYSSNSKSEYLEAEDLVWKDLNLKRKVVELPARRFSNYYLKVAAIILGVLSVSFVAYKLMDQPGDIQVAITTVERVAPPGSKLTTRLPDGSIVTLNSGSKLTFPERFEETDRNVRLLGEAFFEVEHDPDKPFVVTMGGDEVKVLGTSFNIRSYPDDEDVTVSVATGKVAYKVSSGKEVILQVNESVTYNAKQDILTKGIVNPLQAFGWKDRILYFKGSSWDQVLKELNRWYGVDFEVSGDFGNTGTYSGEFKNATLSQVLNSLAFVYRFRFSVEDNKVIIKRTLI